MGAGLHVLWQDYFSVKQSIFNYGRTLLAVGYWFLPSRR
jgi:hypothetical protein